MDVEDKSSFVQGEARMEKRNGNKREITARGTHHSFVPSVRRHQSCIKAGWETKRRNERVGKDENYLQPSSRLTMSTECGKSYTGKAGVTKHFKQVHVGLLEYTCNQCGQVFWSNICLETCSKEYKSNGDLRYHMKKQHGSSTVHCPRCNQGFIQHQNLDIHVKRGNCNIKKVKTPHIEELNSKSSKEQM